MFWKIGSWEEGKMGKWEDGKHHYVFLTLALCSCLLIFLTSQLLLLLSGCGYHFSSLSPVSLPRGYSCLYISRVVNPSQESWLEPKIRSYLRDELTRRGQVRWVSKDKAEILVRINIKEFSTASVKGENDLSVKYVAQVVLEVLMFSARDKTLIWTSGQITGNKSYYNENEKKEAAEQAVEKALELVVDRLGNGF
jgi:outer membrane lipopolysaccharide assembly protein LptE/RlpB